MIVIKLFSMYWHCFTNHLTCVLCSDYWTFAVAENYSSVAPSSFAVQDQTSWNSFWPDDPSCCSIAYESDGWVLVTYDHLPHLISTKIVDPPSLLWITVCSEGSPIRHLNKKVNLSDFAKIQKVTCWSLLVYLFLMMGWDKRRQLRLWKMKRELVFSSLESLVEWQFTMMVTLFYSK